MFVEAHEHEWRYSPPRTVGASGVWTCATCGLYDVAREAPGASQVAT